MRPENYKISSPYSCLGYHWPLSCFWKCSEVLISVPGKSPKVYFVSLQQSASITPMISSRVPFHQQITNRRAVVHLILLDSFLSDKQMSSA